MVSSGVGIGSSVRNEEARSPSSSEKIASTSFARGPDPARVTEIEGTLTGCYSKDKIASSSA